MKCAKDGCNRVARFAFRVSGMPKLWILGCERHARQADYDHVITDLMLTKRDNEDQKNTR